MFRGEFSFFIGYNEIDKMFLGGEWERFVRVWNNLVNNIFL